MALALDLLLEVASNLMTVVPPLCVGLGPVVIQLDLAQEVLQELMLEPEPLWRWCWSFSTAGVTCWVLEKFQ